MTTPADEGPTPDLGPQAAPTHAPTPELVPTPEAEVDRTKDRTVWAAVIVALVVAALGAVVGWLWQELAPRVLVYNGIAPRFNVITLAGREFEFVYTGPNLERAISGDGWFAILGAGTGLILGVVTWALMRRQRGVLVAVALAVGSLLGASLAWWVGQKIGYAQFEHAELGAKAGEQIDGPLSLGASDLSFPQWWRGWPSGAAAIQALLATAAYTVLAGFSAYPDLRDPDPELAEPDPVLSGPAPDGPAPSGPDRISSDPV